MNNKAFAVTGCKGTLIICAKDSFAAKKEYKAMTGWGATKVVRN